MAMRATLVATLPDGRQERHELSPGRSVLGRSPECPVVLADGSVSRRHAEVELAAGSLIITDLGSSNGVLVDGQRVDRIELADGAQVTLGRVTIAVELETLPEATPPPAADWAEDATVIKKGPPPGAQVTAAASGPSADDRKRKRFYMLAGGILVGGLVLIVGASVMTRSGKAPPPEQTSQAPAPPASLEPSPKPEQAAEPQAKPAAASQPAAPQQPSSSQAPQAPRAAQAPQAPQAPRATSPAGPSAASVAQAPQASPAEHMRKGDVYLETGRLLDAKNAYKAALDLEPENPEAAKKLKAAEEAINQKAEAFLAQGMQNYKYLKYESALQDWMRVIYLVPDKNHPLHQKAAEYMEKARAKLSR